ncbi:MAG: patatin-like phospholipase family protein [Candidatus Krumholzibacteria bacterium]|nr:patatin-like phospholipase family protein [Candidatus Krumholzibacteria bacterium]
MYHRSAIYISAFWALLLPALAASPAAGEPPAADRPRIGLALSGGGARGAAHIGVLKVLEEMRIPIDCVAGTSMGSIVGGMYAMGMTPAEIEELVSTIDWSDAFLDDIPRDDRSFRRKRDDDSYLVRQRPGISGFTLRFPPGILNGQKIDLLLKRHTMPAREVRDFDDLGIPYRAVAADIETGEQIVLGGGDLALAIRASMSIPIVFAPREIEGRLLVDGGIACNLPIDVARAMGADIVIAVDISTPLAGRDELRSVIDIADQVSSILTRRNTDVQIGELGPGDLFIAPDLGDITTASFGRSAEAVPVGYAAADTIRSLLAHLSVSEEEYAACERRRRRLLPAEPPTIDGVRVENDSRLADGAITRRLGIEAGVPLDVDGLEEDIARLYGLELFESVYYDVGEEGERSILEVKARENSWGPNYLQLGVAVFEDYEQPNFNLALAYTRTAINRLGGEWRTGIQLGQEPGAFTELHQPLDLSLKYFAHVRASIGEDAANIFDPDGNRIMELGVRRGGIEAALGRELGAWGEVRGGVLRESGRIEVLTGDPAIPDEEFDAGEAYVQFYVDELDALTFPRSGWSLRLRGTAGIEDLGSDGEFRQGTAEGSLALSKGRFTVFLGAQTGTTQDSDAPFQSRFRLGGFASLSGLEQDELIGQHMGLLLGTAYVRLRGGSTAAVYAGGSLEYGNVWESRSEITAESGVPAGSVFVGIDTPIGPIMLAFGLAEGGRTNYYLSLGQALARHRAGLWTRR